MSPAVVLFPSSKVPQQSFEDKRMVLPILLSPATWIRYLDEVKGNCSSSEWWSLVGERLALYDLPGEQRADRCVPNPYRW
jgi:hypothetical protein